MIPSAIFISCTFSWNLGSMPKTSTHVLSTSRNYMTGFLVKTLVSVAVLQYHVDGSLLLASKPLYSCSDVCVRFCGVESQPFSIIVALRQECVLLPLHFVFYMNGGGVRQSHQESTRVSLLGTAKPIVYFWQTIWYCLHSRVVNEPHFEASPNQAWARHLFLKADLGPKATFTVWVKICAISGIGGVAKSLWVNNLILKFCY